jgi:hypothetical protein
MSRLTGQSRLLAPRGSVRRTVLNLGEASGRGRGKTDAHYIERLKSKITVTPSGCWECAGFRHKMRNVKSHSLGYVAFGYRGTTQMAHRLAYRLLVGQIPDGMQVNHKCDNPPCCNPDHLFLGDQNANMRDMADKKRDKAGITHCSRGHELAGANIRLSPTKTGFRRQCLTCEKTVWHKSERHVQWRRAYQKRRRALRAEYQREWRAKKRAQRQGAGA